MKKYFWQLTYSLSGKITNRPTTHHSDGGPYRTRERADEAIRRVISQLEETHGVKSVQIHQSKTIGYGADETTRFIEDLRT